MKLNVYSIFDSAAMFYGRPFFLINENMARRTALDIKADPNTEINRHPQDYSMFLLGTFDDQTAVFDLLPTPVRFISFHEIQLPINLNSEPGSSIRDLRKAFEVNDG